MPLLSTFLALVRYITIAFHDGSALGRVGIETSSIIAVIGARRSLAIGTALPGSLSTLPQAYCLSPAPFRAGEVYKLARLSAQ